MAKKFFPFIVLCGFILAVILYSSNAKVSFHAMDQSDIYTKSIVTTDEQFSINLDMDVLRSLCGTAVFEDSYGQIILTSADLVSSDLLSLTFEAHGNVGANTSTVLTACAYNEGFLQSNISVTPTENVVVKYSFQSSEFENYGNRFAISIFFPDHNSDKLKNLNLTFYDLLLISFSKNI